MWAEIRRATAIRPALHRQYAPMPFPARRPGLYAGEPEACRRELLQIVPILTHLGHLYCLRHHLSRRA